MSHKRYQNPQQGYSRRQQDTVTTVTIEEELALDDQLAKTEFGEDSIASLMGRGPVVEATPAPEAKAKPVQPPATEVKRGAMAEVEEPTNPKIRAVERLLAWMRRGR